MAKYTERFQALLDHELSEKLKSLSASSGTSINHLIRVACEEKYMNAQPTAQPEPVTA